MKRNGLLVASLLCILCLAMLTPALAAEEFWAADWGYEFTHDGGIRLTAYYGHESTSNTSKEVTVPSP